MLRFRRPGLAGLLIVVIGAGVLVWRAGRQLIAPAMRAAGSPPPALATQDVTFPSTSGSVIHGWLSRGDREQGAVLLLHGVRASRRDMLARAEFLHALGFSVLLVDLQAHGESSGEQITFGDLESRDAAAAIEFLRQVLPGERIGVIATSLGAAAIVLSEKPLTMDAVVLESMYPTMEEAVRDRLRLRLGDWGALLTPLLIAQIAPRIGVSPSRLRPIDAIPRLGAPLLLIHGTQDRHTRLAEAEAVFAAAKEPKALWPIEGAAHVDLHRFAGKEYETRVGSFLSSHLRVISNVDAQPEVVRSPPQ